MEKAPISQEDLSLKTFSLIQKLVRGKLNDLYTDYVEDITQTVLLKLFRWKSNRTDVELTEDDWLKIVNVATQNAIKSFYTHKLRRDLATDDEKLDFLANATSQIFTEGNTEIEVRSLLLSLWKNFQTLPLRQKFSLILHNENFILELLLNKCCSISEISDSLGISENELDQLLEKIPLSDDEISGVLEGVIKETISPLNVWKARKRAKLNLITTLKGDK
ncbi:MAG TPA: hypothetical protein PKY82_27830 [Pyrinomonadaceae bacterium]|nr:hypothetical protein [Pyrinomonadaceae bacterium]